jgi:hypothetical protein
MKVFWSWQSDTPGKTGRHFVRAVLNDVLEELKQDPEVQEPSEREESEGALHLDHDIKGTTGIPNLVDTIINKIDSSAVFIADITCVGEVFGKNREDMPRKKLINSNVGIELGYALKSLTDSKVVVLFNEHYGAHSDVPFDLRHKGGAITFKLPPNADKSAISSERARLRSKFLAALRPLLVQVKKATRPLFQETPTTYVKAAYFNRGEVIAEWGEERYNERTQYSYDDSALIYLRLIPVETLSRNLSVSNLREAIVSAPLLGSIQGQAPTVGNRFGVIKWHPGSNPKNGSAKIHSSTQLFRNGEMWGIGSLPLKLRADVETSLGLCLKFPFIPSLALEQLYVTAAPTFLRLMISKVGLSGPWQLVCGITGIEQMYFASPNSGLQFGPFNVNEVETRSIVTGDDESLHEALLKFFEEIWDAAGEIRPKRLYNFPPEPAKS